MGKWADKLQNIKECEDIRQDLDSATAMLRVLRDKGWTFRIDGSEVVAIPGGENSEARTFGMQLDHIKPALLTLLTLEQISEKGRA